MAKQQADSVYIIDSDIFSAVLFADGTESLLNQSACQNSSMSHVS